MDGFKGRERRTPAQSAKPGLVDLWGDCWAQVKRRLALAGEVLLRVLFVGRAVVAGLRICRAGS